MGEGDSRLCPLSGLIYIKGVWALNDDYRISIYFGVSSTFGASFGT